MDHIRSRSHSLANIKIDGSGFKIRPNLTKSRSFKKDKLNNNKNKNKLHEIITFKCIPKKPDNDNNDNNDNKDDENKSFEQLSSSKTIKNGIINIYITETFCFRAARFWNDNITLSFNSRQFREASTLFFSYLMANSDDRKILLNRDNNNNNNIIDAPLKYFDMIGFLLRILIKPDIDAYSTLIKIGEIHLNSYNISPSSYYSMLNALHLTFYELFEKEYNLELKYIFDIIFISSVNIMLSKNNQNNYLNQKYDALNSLYFLQSLDICLFDEIGSEYIYHFLNQSYCNEIPKFLILYNKFKHCNPSNHRKKYKILNNIYNQCISDSSQYQINVPFATYQQIKISMNNIKQQYITNITNLNISNDIFDTAYQQIKRLIQQNHWIHFKNLLKSIQKQSQLNK